jgi:hypothetical protein
MSPTRLRRRAASLTEHDAEYQDVSMHGALAVSVRLAAVALAPDGLARHRGQTSRERVP